MKEQGKGDHSGPNSQSCSCNNLSNSLLLVFLFLLLCSHSKPSSYEVSNCPFFQMRRLGFNSSPSGTSNTCVITWIPSRRFHFFGYIRPIFGRVFVVVLLESTVYFFRHHLTWPEQYYQEFFFAKQVQAWESSASQRFQWKRGFVNGFSIARAQKPGFSRCRWALSLILLSDVNVMCRHLGWWDQRGAGASNKMSPSWRSKVNHSTTPQSPWFRNSTLSLPPPRDISLVSWSI